MGEGHEKCQVLIAPPGVDRPIFPEVERHSLMTRKPNGR